MVPAAGRGSLRHLCGLAFLGKRTLPPAEHGVCRRGGRCHLWGTLLLEKRTLPLVGHGIVKKEDGLDLLLIRHFATPGNLKKQYIGCTDEPLCPQAEAMYPVGDYPPAQAVITSPMIRCRQTAQLIARGVPLYVEPLFAERSFGPYEGRTYEELKEDAAYRRWIDTGGMIAPSGMEPADAFSVRCLRGMKRSIERLIKQKEQASDVLFVVHGGTIMEIMHSMDTACPSLYDRHVKNGNGYRVSFDEDAFLAERRCLRIKERLDYV